MVALKSDAVLRRSVMLRGSSPLVVADLPIDQVGGPLQSLEKRLESVIFIVGNRTSVSAIQRAARRRQRSGTNLMGLFRNVPD